jgi:hypothetical protein
VERELGVSVNVAIYQDLGMALNRIRDLRRAGGVGFYLSPFEQAGVRYYRLQAGPVSTPDAARDLLRRLYDAGQVTAMEDYAIRPTAWAYHLGDHGSLDEASARRRELESLGVPTYLVEIPYTAGASSYRIYAGAYEFPGEAEAMADILAAAGIAAELVQRTGQPIT